MRKSISLQRIVILIFFGLLALGQFQRIQLSQNIAIYYHELLIIVLGFSAFSKKNSISSIIEVVKKTQPLNLFLFALTISYVVNIINIKSNLLTPLFYLLRVFLYATLIPSLYILQNNRTFKFSITKSFLVLGIIFAFGGLIQYFLFPNLANITLLGWDNHLYRAVGTLLDPNYLGLLITLGLIISIQSKSKFINLVRLLLIITLLLTYSRSSYLAAFAATFVYSIQQKKIKYLLLIITLFIAVALILPRRGGEGSRLERVASISRRIDSSQFAWDLYKQKPIFGIGFNAYKNYLPNNSNYGFTPSHPSSPDNSILLILSTSGLVGLSSFLYLSVSLLKKWKYHPIILPSLAAVLVHSVFNNSLFYPWIMVWIFMLISENLFMESSAR